MPQNDLVSIVIPCYRQSHYLQNAIDSCLAQTHRDIEILVVNDGSDDDTEAIATSYGCPVRHIFRENGGLSAARNTGIAAARGNWIKFLDADDHLAPDHLEVQLGFLHSQPDCIGACTVRAYWEDDPTRAEDIVPHFHAFLPDFLRQPDSAVHAFLFPADIVHAVRGFNEDVRIAEDWEFFCRVGKLKPQVISDQRLGAYYRLRAGSMSRDRSGMVLSVALQLLKLHAEFKSEPDCTWFGKDLLFAEQQTYRRLLVANLARQKVAKELLTNIEELQHLFGVHSESWKYSALCNIIGFRLAEEIYAQLVKQRKRLAI
jgi:glycosyltransferase involved in cell wall biosynthesis